MLRNLNTGKDPHIRGHVVVIGGGNSAIDAARSAVRLGAESVTICYRRKRRDMPARAAEVRGALEEGVKIEYLTAPVKIMSRVGKVRGLTMIRMKLGDIDKSGRRKPEPIANSEFIRRADTVIVATGQRPHVGETVLGNKFMVDQGGRVNVDTKFSTSHPAVFAAGDVVTGPATVVGSMAQGRQAAARVAEYLMGDFPAWGVPLDESLGGGNTWRLRRIPPEISAEDVAAPGRREEGRL